MSVRAAVLGLLGAVALASAAFASPEAETAFREGNQLYQQGRFAEAAQAYERVLALGVTAPELEYNLANAQVKAGNLAAAVLHYRRSLALDPTYESARKNLEYARSLTQDLKPEAPPRQGPDWLARFRLGPARAAFLIFLAVTLIVAGGLWRLFGARPPAWIPVVQAVLGGFALLAAGALVFEWGELGKEEGVITAAEIEVRSGPGEAYTVAFRLHAGTEVALERTGPGWREVRISDNLVGWVPQGALEPI
jgi:tetratricopeptide (TPR) repeat protein